MGERQARPTPLGWRCHDASITAVRRRSAAIDPQIAVLIEKIHALESELDGELAKSRAALRIGMEHGRIAFEAELLRRHRELRQKLLPYVLGANPLVILTAPVIYAGIVPFLLLDLFVSVYQAVCFPIYGIAKVKRADHLVFDRHHLAYLNALEKLNCAYCSYANGIVAFTREIAARTEQYWCPISTPAVSSAATRVTCGSTNTATPRVIRSGSSSCARRWPRMKETRRAQRREWRCRGAPNNDRLSRNDRRE